MNAFTTGLNVFAWIFVRLPRAFSIPFAVFSLLWIFGGFAWANRSLAQPAAALAGALLHAHLSPRIVGVLADDIEPFIHALAVIVLFAIGFTAAYNLSALINWVFVVTRTKPRRPIDGPPQAPVVTHTEPDPLQHIERIGIVLAGGGAKGAYQAGALRSIYRFLEQHDALRKVRVISGTSIGSWNALFWLANLIRPDSGWSGQSVHEKWWRQISATGLAAPSWYIPFLRNAFLSSRPWQQSFDQVFGRGDVAAALRETPVHFYLTRSNVGTGTIECATNNPAPPATPNAAFEILDPGEPGSYQQRLKEAVFASMDLPPLFPFMRRGTQSYEDGGVIDNLPIAFAAAEHCDLLFILPLNADFEATPNTHSVLARLLRVMDVRQGALERSGFKMLYLYNELATLRAQAETRVAENDASVVAPNTRLAYSLARRNNPINVFAVCPARSFVEEVIDTTDLWKQQGAAEAFETLRDRTAALLPGFSFEGQQTVSVAIIDRDGAVTWNERF